MVSFVISALAGAIISIIVGLVILLFPKTLNYAVGLYLLIIGVLYFVGQMGI